LKNAAEEAAVMCLGMVLLFFNRELFQSFLEHHGGFAIVLVIDKQAVHYFFVPGFDEFIKPLDRQRSGRGFIPPVKAYSSSAF
jgi:hypothetical protein